MELYTISNLSKLLNIPDTTFRNWRDRYHDIVPSIGEGRSRKYPKESIVVFQAISQLSKNGKTLDEIRHELLNQFPVQGKVQTVNPQVPRFDIQKTEENTPSTVTLEMWQDMFRQSLKDAFSEFIQEQTIQMNTMQEIVNQLHAETNAQSRRIDNLQAAFELNAVQKSRKETHSKSKNINFWKRIDMWLTGDEEKKTDNGLFAR